MGAADRSTTCLGCTLHCVVRSSLHYLGTTVSDGDVVVSAQGDVREADLYWMGRIVGREGEVRRD